MCVYLVEKSVSIIQYDNFMKKTLSAIVNFFRLPIMAYKQSDFVSDVARLVLSEYWESVHGDKYHLTVENERYSVTFWVANKMYGYFSDGEILNKTKDTSARWYCEMPARELLFEVEKRFRSACDLVATQDEVDRALVQKSVFCRKQSVKKFMV